MPKRAAVNVETAPAVAKPEPIDSGALLKRGIELTVTANVIRRLVTSMILLIK